MLHDQVVERGLEIRRSAGVDVVAVRDGEPPGVLVKVPAELDLIAEL